MMLLTKIVSDRKLSGVLLFLLSFAVFSPSINNDFVWDDYESIVDQRISLTAGDIYHNLVPPENKSKRARYYRPVVYFSYAADTGIWGYEARGFHISNVIFFSVSVVLFYIMSLLVLGTFTPGTKSTAAFLAAVLFALHPMHVESVSWIAGRTDVLCGLFLFLAIISHIASYKNLWLTVITLTAFALTLLSKEVGIVFPVLVISYDVFAGRFLKRQSLIKYLLYLAVLALYFYLRGRAFINLPEISRQVSAEPSAAVKSGIEQVAVLPAYIGVFKTLVCSYFAYISKLVFPSGFNAFITGVPGNTYYLISSIITLLLLAVVTAASAVRKRYVVSFCIIWIIVSLGPSAFVSVVSIASTPLAERYLFIPSAGFCILIAYFLVRGFVTRRYRIPAVIAVSAIIVFYAALTVDRQKAWSSDLELWKDTVRKSPYHALPHSNYGLALSRNGMYEEAVNEYKIALLPELGDTPRGKAQTANNLGLAYLETEDYDNAELWFQKAVGYEPDYGRTYYHLGLIYYIKGEITGSRDYYIRAQEYVSKTFDYYRGYGKAHLLMANIYVKLGEPQKAVEQANLAIESGIKGGLFEEASDIIKIYDKAGNY